MTTSASPATSPRALAPDDLFAIKLVGNPVASPDGAHVAWVVVTLSKEKDTYLSAIWTAKADGSDARQLTSGIARDTAPVWSPDGTRIAFISNRAAAKPYPKAAKTPDEGESFGKKPERPDPNRTRNQIWVITLNGGEAQQITTHANGASSAAWSPDGTEIAFVGADNVSADDDVRAPLTHGEIADERIIHDLRYRFDARGWLETYSHIWKVDVATGESTQLTFGDVNDGQPAWSPDGETIAFAGNRRDDRKVLGASSILTIPATGGDVTVLGPDDASFGSPTWSPDGSKIAFLGHLDAKTGGALNTRIWTINADGTEIQDHTADYDVTFGDASMSDVVGDAAGPDLIWLDATNILALASDHGETRAESVDITTNAITTHLGGKRRVSGVTVAGDTLVYAAGLVHVPFELFTAKLDGTDETQITFINDTFTREVALSPVIDIEVTSHDGTPIQAWLIPPYGFDETSDAKHPLILQIHGGPHAMYGYAMFHEMQLMAAKGYAVLFSNPRGSSGYGEQFTGITRGVWGESDMPDVIASLETAIAQHPWIDAERLGVTGGSYGGYLTNWIVSHDTRFKAAVTQRCVSNFYSFFGTSDIGFSFGEFEFGGTPWADTEKLLKHSPITYVDKIETPLLIIHNELDFRCPIEQAEQMYTALKYLGREVGFVRIPGESHGLSRNGTPSRRLARLHHMIGWFDSHL